MGIRYYAYAFDADRAQQALDDPRGILSTDPLADAWGLEPHASASVATFEQVPAKRDMLYLDKAWSALQSLTEPSSEHSRAYRMFEGAVTMHDLGWEPWVRAIFPEEVPAIHDALSLISEQHVREWAQTGSTIRDADEELRYVVEFLGRAQEFVAGLVRDGRGMVYLIG